MLSCLAVQIKQRQSATLSRSPKVVTMDQTHRPRCVRRHNAGWYDWGFIDAGTNIVFMLLLIVE